MMESLWNERIIDRMVTYTLEVGGKVYLVENVPARINVETGEQLFSPETVERLQKILLGKKKPVRTVKTPVYDFAA